MRKSPLDIPIFTWQPNSPNISLTESLYPTQYFLKYVPDELFESIATFTHMYALQQRKAYKPSD